VAEPTAGGEAVTAAYEALKERIDASAATGMDVAATGEEPATPF
jgi:hypothetical protein